MTFHELLAWAQSGLGAIALAVLLYNALWLRHEVGKARLEARQAWDEAARAWAELKALKENR